MKLDDRQRRILQTVEMLANVSIPIISRRLRLKESVIRYNLHELKQLGVIGTKRAFIDYYSLGLTQYVVYFSLGGSSKTNSERFLEQLSRLPKVWWIAKVGGSFQYAASIAVSHMAEILEVLEGLTAKLQVTMPVKTITPRLLVSRFPRKFLSNMSDKLPIFTMGNKWTQPIKLDEIDKNIIHVVAYRGELSNRELAEKLKLPKSTFDRRLNNLESSGIIQGYFYELNLDLVGYQQFILLVKLRGFSKSVRERLYIFATKHKHIRKFVYCLGEWDCELEVNLKSAEMLPQISQELFDTFDGHVLNISSIPLFKHLSTPPFEI